MGVKRKFTEAQRAEALRLYGQKIPVTQIAKVIGCSKPLVYRWIQTEKEALCEAERTARMRPETLEREKEIDKDLLIRRLRDENEMLRRRVFTDMVRHGEL
jgi:transposase-like protein